MMKKIFNFVIATLVLTLLVVGGAEAATKARTASYDKGIMGVYGVGDLSSGNTVEVDGDGNLGVAIKSGDNAQDIDSDGNAAVELFEGTDQAAIDGDGNQQVKQWPSTYSVTPQYPAPSSGVGYTADRIVHTGACTVYGIQVTSAAASDYALIYDALSAIGQPEFDIFVGVAFDTKSVPIPSGVTFSTGIYIDSKHDGMVTSIQYDG